MPTQTTKSRLIPLLARLLVGRLMHLLGRNPRDEVLYKYRSMATAQAVTHTLDILDHHRLYCAPPSSFNDPFECRCELSFEAREETKNERAKRWLLEHRPDLSEEQAATLAPERWRTMEERTGNEQLHEVLRDDLGIVSFGPQPDDILMWSHYAGRHNGICLEFRPTRLEHVEFFGQAQRVRYQRRMPAINFYTTSEIERARAYALTKAEHWRYEGESRIVIPNAEEEGRFVQIPRGALTAVFLGACITDDNRQLVLKRLVSAAQSETVRVYQAEISPDTYELMFPRIEPDLD